MNSLLKTFVTILLTAGVVGFATYSYVNNRTETPVEEDQENNVQDGEKDTASNTTANTVAYSRPESNINLQFELPKGNAAIEDIEGEGTLQVKYYIGKLNPESGPNVIRSSLSVADYVQIIPSYNDEIVTLEDWRKNGGVYDGSDALETKNLTIAGITAIASTFPAMGETWIVQFVKDKNYYEIHIEGTLEDEVVAKIIDTFSFTEK